MHLFAVRFLLRWGVGLAALITLMMLLLLAGDIAVDVALRGP